MDCGTCSWLVCTASSWLHRACCRYHASECKVWQVSSWRSCLTLRSASEDLAINPPVFFLDYSLVTYLSFSASVSGVWKLSWFTLVSSLSRRCCSRCQVLPSTHYLPFLSSISWHYYRVLLWLMQGTPQALLIKQKLQLPFVKLKILFCFTK